MKQTLLLILCTLAAGSTWAQIPVNRTQAMVEKSTYSQCPPCGGWGWTIQEELITDNMVGNNPNAIVLETHGYYSAFHSETAYFLIQSWMGNTFPNWSVNNKKDTNYYITTRSSVKKSVDSLAAISPIASTGFYYTLTGSTIKLYTKTQFWKAATGTYSLAAFVVEDSAYGEQFGQPGNNAYHRYVLRDRLSKYTFGDTLSTTGATANQTFTKNFTYNITRTDWSKSHLSILTVLFRRNAADSSRSEVINVNSIMSKSTGVGNLNAVDQLIAYPNPANDMVHISGALNVASDTRLALLNAVGQIVYEKLLPWKNNQLSEDIPVRDLSPGVYELLISSEGAQSMQRISVTR